MGKSDKSIDKVIQRDIQDLKKGELSKILGGKMNIKKTKWNNNGTGLNSIMPR